MLPINAILKQLVAYVNDFYKELVLPLLQSYVQLSITFPHPTPSLNNLQNGLFKLGNDKAYSYQYAGN